LISGEDGTRPKVERRQDPVLELRGIAKHFGDREILHDLHLRVRPRAVTAVVGASGCGKSTLLKLCNGLIRPDAGEVRAFGAALDYQQLPVLRRRIGYAVQGSALFPHLTARDNITLAARLFGWTAAQVDERLLELLSLMHIEETLLEQFPHQLSGGQQQRVSLSRAMMLRPEVLLLDEPFAAIDPITRHDIHEQLLEALQHEPATVVLVTHDMREAMRLAEELVVMHAGEIRMQVNAAQLQARASQVEAERLLQDLLGEMRAP
jgi:osmoprotectant transport system ATP-binding protein